MSEEITKKVIETIAEQLSIPADKISLDADFHRDLKADSLAVTEIGLALENVFDLEMEEDDDKPVKTVRDLVDRVVSRIG